jgi:hypothetical protein
LHDRLKEPEAYTERGLEQLMARLGVKETVDINLGCEVRPIAQRTAGELQREGYAAANIGELARRGAVDPRREALEQGNRVDCLKPGERQHMDVREGESPARRYEDGAPARGKERLDLRLIQGIFEENERALLPKDSAIEAGYILQVIRERNTGEEGAYDAGHHGGRRERLSARSLQIDDDLQLRITRREFLKERASKRGFSHTREPADERAGAAEPIRQLEELSFAPYELAIIRSTGLIVGIGTKANDRIC